MTTTTTVRDLKPGDRTRSITGAVTVVVDVWPVPNVWGAPINYSLSYRREDDEHVHTMAVNGSLYVDLLDGE